MVTERQKAFRQEYRSRIMGWYDGYLHVAIIYAMGAAAFTIYLQHIHDVTALEWLTIPVTLLAAENEPIFNGRAWWRTSSFTRIAVSMWPSTS